MPARSRRVTWTRDVRQVYEAGPGSAQAHRGRVNAPFNRPPLQKLNAGFTGTAPRTFAMSGKTRTNAGRGPSPKWQGAVESNPFMRSSNPFLGTPNPFLSANEENEIQMNVDTPATAGNRGRRRDSDARLDAIRTERLQNIYDDVAAKRVAQRYARVKALRSLNPVVQGTGPPESAGAGPRVQNPLAQPPRPVRMGPTPRNPEAPGAVPSAVPSAAPSAVPSATPVEQRAAALDDPVPEDGPLPGNPWTGAQPGHTAETGFTPADRDLDLLDGDSPRRRRRRRRNATPAGPGAPEGSPPTVRGTGRVDDVQENEPEPAPLAPELPPAPLAPELPPAYNSHPIREVTPLPTAAADAPPPPPSDPGAGPRPRAETTRGGDTHVHVHQPPVTNPASADDADAPAAAAAAAAGATAATVATAENKIDTTSKMMKGASPELLAKLAADLGRDPALQSLASKGLLKWNDLLKEADGTVTIDEDKVTQVKQALRRQGLQSRDNASAGYARYARERTVPRMQQLPSGVRVVTKPHWLRAARPV